MKKLFICLGLAAFAFGAKAQQAQRSIDPGVVVKSKPISAPSKAQFRNSSRKTRGGSIYLSWVDFMAAQEGISSTDLGNRSSLYFMFPDSNMRYDPPNQGYGISFRSISQVLDPFSPIIENNTPAGNIFVSKLDNYTVDSIWVGGSYAKVTPSVDSMIMSVVHSGGTNLPEYYFSGQAADFGTDTTRFLASMYSPSTYLNGVYQTNASGAPAAYTVKRALTSADSSDYTMGNSSFGVKYMGFSANSFAVPAGERAAVSFTFKPGFSYAAGDSIGKNNKYLYLSYEPNGDNTFMPFYPADRNMSGVVHKDSTNWSPLYIPTLAWTQPYGCEVHDIIWKVTCNSCYVVGTENVDPLVNMYDAYPNPASTNVTVSFNLKEASDNVMVDFSNAIGQVVKRVNIGNKAAGVTVNQNISVSELPKGMYIYTIRANNQTVSDKLIIE